MTLSRKAELQRKPFRKSEPKPAKGPKPKRCKNRACRGHYLPDPRQPWKDWCSDDCAVVIALERVAKKKAAKAKSERAADKVTREKAKTRGALQAEAQAAFNAFIRERDKDQPCICCGSFDAGDSLTGGGWDAGHWISRGHAPHLRFDECNVHKQRKGCNRPGGTTRAKFRAGLVPRIGIEAVQELERLEYEINTPKHTRDELRAIRDDYRARLRALKASA